MCVTRICTDVYALDTSAVERQTQQGKKNKVTEDTKNRDPTLFNVSRHRCTTTGVQPYLGNKVICD